MLTSATLKAAKRELDRNGWCQGWLVRPTSDQKCVRGAINFAARGGALRDWPAAGWCAAVQLLARVTTGTCSSSCGYDLARWNNASARTVEDVYAAFDAAIAIAEEEERVTSGLAHGDEVGISDARPVEVSAGHPVEIA